MSAQTEMDDKQEWNEILSSQFNVAIDDEDLPNSLSLLCTRAQSIFDYYCVSDAKRKLQFRAVEQYEIDEIVAKMNTHMPKNESQRAMVN